MHRASRRAVTKHGWGNEIEAEDLAEVVGGDFTAMEARLEVPQRSLTAKRFVDRLGVHICIGDVDEERGVAAPRHAPLDLDLTAGEDVKLVSALDQFIRGHAWPSGSIGLPHH